MQPTRTEAIANFLKASTLPDLANLYNPEMEVQVNVARGNGTLIKQEYKGREWSSYTDGMQTWKPIRIPRNADTDPVYEDKPMSYDLAIHAEGIGMTGWNWVKRKSYHVAFDFDAMLGHSDKHGKKLSDAELQDIEKVVENIPWTTLRLSTSGKGRHLYVHLKPVETANHTEHAALARSILSMLSGCTGYDFTSKVDIAGGNMWVWHRKMIGTQGLTIIKQGGILDEVPANWRDHLRVVTRKSNKTLPQFIENVDIENPEQLFQELTGQRNNVTLDSEHKKLIQYLTDHRCRWWWDNDHWMLVTHTSHLMEAHIALKMKGTFDTLATGKDYGNDHNAFCFPLRAGAWTVRRYSPGTKEADSWEQDGKNWTRCLLNKQPDLKILSKLHNGIELEKGGYVFLEARHAVNCLCRLGIQVEIPEKYQFQKTTVKYGKNESKIIVKIDALTGARQEDVPGWLFEKTCFTKVFTNYQRDINDDSEPLENYDDIVRHIVSTDGSDLGWIVKADGEWRQEPLSHARSVLKSLNLTSKDLESVIGNSVLKAWKLVNKPFQPEYPGDREWNRHAAQFRYAPSPVSDNLRHPTFNLILDHCGENLNTSIKENEWCVANNIQTGADYLRLWLASLFKFTHEPLPYLAFWSEEQNTGKSIFHEMLTEVVLRRGYMKADKALTSESGFNAELENAILCIIEETNLSKNRSDVYNRLKDWVTSPQILFHKKHVTPYMIQNLTHYIQTTNDRAQIPIFPGDTRITVINVSKLENVIPKPELFKMLQKEAPDFIRALLDLEIPRSNDRLHIPVIETADKRDAAEANSTELDRFIKEKCYEVPGATILLSDFWEKFTNFLDPSERPFWTKNKMTRNLPAKIVKGRLTTNVNVHYGNISFNPDEVPGDKLYVDKKDFLRPLQSEVPK